GIADAAGVTRLTVYRHFPDDAALFEACSSDWLSRQQPPDPATWADVTNPSQRLRSGHAVSHLSRHRLDPAITAGVHPRARPAADHVADATADRFGRQSAPDARGCRAQCLVLDLVVALP